MAVEVSDLTIDGRIHQTCLWMITSQSPSIRCCFTHHFPQGPDYVSYIDQTSRYLRIQKSWNQLNKKRWKNPLWGQKSCKMKKKTNTITTGRKPRRPPPEVKPLLPHSAPPPPHFVPPPLSLSQGSTHPSAPWAHEYDLASGCGSLSTLPISPRTLSLSAI